LKTKLVKDLMVPLSEYATVSEDATLSDAVAALKQSQADFDPDQIPPSGNPGLGDQDQKIVGKVNFQSPFSRRWNPNMTTCSPMRHPAHLGFTRKYQRAIFESMKLWQDPMDQGMQKSGTDPSQDIYGHTQRKPND
jgi:hypothetical protein